MKYLLRFCFFILILSLSCDDNSTSPENKDPELSLSISSVTFEAGENYKSITINNAGGGDLTWEAQENPEEAWLSINPTSGQSGDLLNVNINTSILNPGTTTGNIQITSNGGDRNLPITVLISMLSLSAKSFSFQAGETTKTLDIQNTGAGKLNWSISSFDPKPWLTINPVTGENNATVTFTTDWDLVTSENATADLVINSTGGSENITISAFSFPSSIFLDDFSGDLSYWNIKYANADIVSGFLELTGTSSTYVGQAEHELSSPQSVPWLYRIRYGRKNNLSNGISMMYMSTNDVGTVIIPSYRFDVFSADEKNWAAAAFVYNTSTFSGGWAYLEDNSKGFSYDIDGEPGGVNDISWAITSSKLIQIYVKGNIFYESNVLNELNIGYISTDLEAVEIWTTKDQTTWADWALVRDVDDPDSRQVSISPTNSIYTGLRKLEMQLANRKFDEELWEKRLTLKELVEEIR